MATDVDRLVKSIDLQVRAGKFAEAVAAQVRAEIAAANQSVSSVARFTGINRETLDRWVKGDRPLSMPTLFRIAEALQLDPSVIVARAEERYRVELEQAQPAVSGNEDYDVTHGGPESLALAAHEDEKK